VTEWLRSGVETVQTRFRPIVVIVQSTLEYERKLDAPEGFRLPALGGSALEPRHFTSVYYDTPPHSLAAAGITLRRRTEHGRSLWQLKLPASGARLELEVAGGPTLPGELRRLLTAHLRHGEPAPVAELRTRRSGELVTRNGATAEVTVDDVAVMDARRVAGGFVEVEIELRSGDPRRLDELAAELTAAGAEPGTETPKLFRVLGLEPAGPRLPENPFEALRALLRVQLRQIHGHDPGTRLGQDPESLHDMRVAVRRSRALLRAGGTLVASDTSGLAAELKGLGAVLGAVRDLDVLLERLTAEAAELGPPDERTARALLGALRSERSRDRRRLLRYLNGRRYLELLDRFAREVEELEPSGAEVSLETLARKELKKARRLVRELPEEPADEQLHAVRKQGKRARYAFELAGREAVVQRAKKVQDALGEHQDAVVAMERLRALAASAPPEQALAAGRLVEREHARRAHARAAWRKTWRRLERAAR
jgi:CHAD domain-containing protein